MSRGPWHYQGHDGYGNDVWARHIGGGAVETRRYNYTHVMEGEPDDMEPQPVAEGEEKPLVRLRFHLRPVDPDRDPPRCNPYRPRP